jgi:hypothetical protein
MKGPIMKRIVFFVLCYICVTAGAFGVEFQGFTNTALGSAIAGTNCCVSNLSSSGQDGSAYFLYVTNLGSSGQDGLAITLPANQSALSVAWVPLDESNALPAGASITEQAIGNANGIAGSVLGSVTVTKMGTSNYSLSANYSAIGASNYTAQAYLNGVLVGQATGLSGTSMAQANLMPSGDDVGDIITPLSQDWPGGPATVTIGTTLQVTCDRLVISPENVSGGGNPSALQITTTGISSLFVYGENESLVYQGLTNTTLGQTAVSETCCVSNLGSGGQDGFALSYYITNLGSGGQDGVGITISLPTNLTALSVAWETLDVSNTLPVGASIIEEAVGTADGVAGTVLGTVTVTKMGTSNYSISADYSDVGASSYTAQAYLNGVLVGQATGSDGASLVQANIPPNGDDIGDIITPLSQEWLGGPASVTIGGTVCTCSHLIVSPEGGASTGNASTLQISTVSIPTFTIISENESQIFQGLTNTSLASATVNVVDNPEDGLAASALYITNLSSGGQDGVSFAMPAIATNMEVFWQDLDDSDTLAVGAYIQEQLVGTANGITNGVLGTLTMTKDGTTNYTIQPDFTPLGTTVSYLASAYSNGTLVAQATFSPGFSLAHPGEIAVSSGFATVGPTNHNWQWSMGWGTNPITFMFPGRPLVTCDHLFFAPQNVTFTAPPTALQVVGYELPSVNIYATTVSPLGLNIRGQNGANLITLQWIGPGVLQQSSDLSSWTDITNSTNPFTVSLSGPRQTYYRIREHWTSPN